MMIGLTFILLIILLIIFITDQTVDVHITAETSIKIKLSFTFLALSLKFSTNKGRKHSAKELFRSTLFALRLLKEVISRSRVLIRSFSYKVIPRYNSYIPKISLAVLCPILLTYIKSKAQIFEYEPKANEAPLDLSLSLPLSSLIISLMKASYYTVMRKLKRS